MNPRVKICAIAKDEAPYLAYWVFHHLYFGFDEIHICLNRTTDSSAYILDAIAKVHPNVTYSYYDWVDYLRPQIAGSIQTIAYAREMQRAREQSLADYLFFIDIDEFWCPADWKSGIKTCLKEHGMPESLSFQWAMEPRCEEPFGLIQQRNRYRVTGQVKTAFRIGTPVETVRLHIPEFSNSVRPIIAGGGPFVSAPENDQVYWMKGNPDQNLPYFLVHRVCRSKLEYMVSLTRGNPNESKVLKLNRGAGYFGKDFCNFEHAISGDQYSNYARNIRHLSEGASITVQIDRAQALYLERAHEFYGAVPEAYDRNRDQLLKCINGMEDARLSELLQTLEGTSANNFVGDE